MFENQYLKIPKLIYDEELRLKFIDLFYEQNTHVSEWRKYGNTDKDSIFVRPIDRANNDLVSILEKQINPKILYPKESFKWARMKPGSFIPAHMDGRNVCVIVPVIYKNTYTTIYDRPENERVERQHDVPMVNGSGEVGILKSKGSKWNYGKVHNVVEVHRWSTSTPFILNGQWPHGIDITQSDEGRVIITISFNNEYDDWDKINNLINTGEFWNNYND